MRFLHGCAELPTHSKSSAQEATSSRSLFSSQCWNCLSAPGCPNYYATLDPTPCRSLQTARRSNQSTFPVALAT